jgi:cell wall-associated NlpC family hydrolase
MRVILSEEQIKYLFRDKALFEEVEDVANAGAPATGMQTDPVLHMKNFLSNAVSKVNGNASPYANYYGNYNGNNDSGYIGPSGNNQAWLDTVKDTFNHHKLIFGNQYNQKNIIGHDRADCSGFVYSALRNAGYNVGNVRDFNTATMITDPRFTNAISRGFRRIQWNGPADVNKLPPGTILAFRAGDNNKRYGHTIILGADGKSYDYGGNKHSEHSPNLNQVYTAAWVPIA